MIFFKLSVIDKTVLSTAIEVLLPRFEGIKPQHLFDRTWFIFFYSFKNEWRRNSCMHLNLLWNLSLKSVINCVRIEAFNFPCQKVLRSPTEQMSHSGAVQCLIRAAPGAVSWGTVALILEMAEVEDAAVGLVTVWARGSSCWFWHDNLSSLPLDSWLLWKEEVWRRNTEEPSLWLSTGEVEDNFSEFLKTFLFPLDAQRQ